MPFITVRISGAHSCLGIECVTAGQNTYPQSAHRHHKASRWSSCQNACRHSQNRRVMCATHCHHNPSTLCVRLEAYWSKDTRHRRQARAHRYRPQRRGQSHRRRETRRDRGRDSATRTSDHKPQRDRSVQWRPRPGSRRSGFQLPPGSSSTEKEDANSCLLTWFVFPRVQGCFGFRVFHLFLREL